MEGNKRNGQTEEEIGLSFRWRVWGVEEKDILVISYIIFFFFLKGGCIDRLSEWI